MALSGLPHHLWPQGTAFLRPDASEPAAQGWVLVTLPVGGSWEPGTFEVPHSCIWEPRLVLGSGVCE